MKATGERFIPGQAGQIELEHLNRYYFVINQIDLKDKVILDIASGEGYGSDLLAQHSKFVYGVDISSEAVEHSKNKYRRENLTYLVGSADAIPIQNSTIDVVVSFETIEHHDKHSEMFSEIKRVLKTDGILIMSSPDKYYYSDLPKKNNEFHVKELYYSDFMNLVNTHFKSAIYFNQKVFSGSIIALDETSGNYNKPLIINKTGMAFSFYPVYNIVVATNEPDLAIKHPLIFYSETDKIITQSDVERAIQSVKKSWTFRLGNCIIAPIHFCLSLVKPQS